MSPLLPSRWWMADSRPTMRTGVELALEAWNTQPIIDGDDGVCIRTLDGDGAVYGVATSPDGEIFTTSGHHDLPRGRQRGGAFRQWDSATGQCTLDIEHDDKMLCIAVSPDGSTIAYGSHDNIIHLWDATGRVKKKLIGHTDAMCRLAFSNDGCALVSGSYDDSIEVWDVDTGTSRLKLTEHGNIVYGVAISPDGSAIYSASEDRTIKKWSSDTGECVRTMNHDQPVHSIAVSPDGTIIAFGSKCGTIHFWDSENGQRAQTLDRHFAIVWSLDFSPDGRTLVSGSADGTIKQWDVATGVLIRTFSGHEMVVWAVAFSRDGTTIVSGSDDRTAKVWSTLPRTPQFLATVNQLCSSPVAPDADITIDPGDSVALPCDLARILLHFLATGLPRSFTMTLTRPVARVELDENSFIKTDDEDDELASLVKVYNDARSQSIPQLDDSVTPPADTEPLSLDQQRAMAEQEQQIGMLKAKLAATSSELADLKAALLSPQTARFPEANRAKDISDMLKGHPLLSAAIPTHDGVGHIPSPAGLIGRLGHARRQPETPRAKSPEADMHKLLSGILATHPEARWSVRRALGDVLFTFTKDMDADAGLNAVSNRLLMVSSFVDNVDRARVQMFNEVPVDIILHDNIATSVANIGACEEDLFAIPATLWGIDSAVALPDLIAELPHVTVRQAIGDMEFAVPIFREGTFVFTPDALDIPLDDLRPVLLGLGRVLQLMLHDGITLPADVVSDVRLGSRAFLHFS
ncbi:WD domain G-beta repeat [Carpediemonas membranifera]|uniref:WD domain G-beta repeat n=1 Tax=Carpediemonas membranifera TaxID=201153 RepID=A0A8J6B0H9_9EUKA|nr:WD domain G-beta repeat [Carpediemonas membranifera]|eukprot:KAG9395790.1 WD domain G-beta repeat [Carpediemonas membranifera]